MLLSILLLAMLLPALNISAQNVLSNIGAKNEALGASTATSSDEWSLWRNPAGLSSMDRPAISFGVRRAQGVQAFTRSIVVAYTTKIGSISAGASAFGDDIYNEQAASLGLAHRIGPTGIGVRADIMQLRIDGHTTKTVAGITVGCIAKLTPRLSIGACARNVNLPEWARGQPLPVVLNAGVSFQPIESFFVIGEVEKNTDFDPTIKGAFEYSLRKKFFVRTGFNLFPNVAFGGIGLRTWRLGFDYAFRFGYLPGHAQQLSVVLLMGKSKQKQ